MSGVAFIIILNTALSHWLSRRGHAWSSIFREFVVMAAVNVGLALLYTLLLPRYGGAIGLTDALFFILLLTVLVTLYDRYRLVYQMRFAAS